MSFKVGDKVKHTAYTQFGTGTVISISDNNNENQPIRVRWGSKNEVYVSNYQTNGLQCNAYGIKHISKLEKALY